MNFQFMAKEGQVRDAIAKENLTFLKHNDELKLFYRNHKIMHRDQESSEDLENALKSKSMKRFL